MKGNVMSREIKFRAWAIASEKMFYPDTENGWELLNGKLVKLPNTILMQYTCLLDKNGKDLGWWEGDLLELDGGASGTHEIKWDDNGACFMCGDELLVNVRDGYKTENIGNIHQHPDLLK